jgi:thioredoxin-like negative regulator of GroEL
VFEAASERHPDAVFAKVNTDEQQELAAEFEIRGIPTLLVLRQGIALFMQAGALPGPALEELISKAKSLDMDDVRAELERGESEAG